MESIWADEEALWGLLFLVWVLLYLPKLGDETADAVNITKEKDLNKIRIWADKKIDPFLVFWFSGLALLLLALALSIPAQATALLLGFATLCWFLRKLYKRIKR